MPRARPFLLAAALASACSPTTPPFPVGAHVGCSSDVECPGGTICKVALGRCVPSEQTDQVAPSVVQASIQVWPATARVGDPVSIAFDTTEELGVAPVLELAAGNGRRAAGLVSSAGLHHVFAFSPSAGDGEGAVTLHARLVDLAGNLAQDAPAGALTFDFTPPTVDAVTVTPPVAAAGVPVTVEVTFSEAPGAPPRLALEGGAGFAAASALDPRHWRFTRAATGAEPAGPATLVLDFADAAGNGGQRTFGDLLAFDFAPPALVGPAVIPVPNARQGQAAVVRITFDEPLAADPVAALAPPGGGAAIPLAVAERVGTTYTFFRAVGAADPEGTWQARLVSAVDRGGNVLAEVVLGTFTVDRTAPTAVAGPTPSHPNRLYRRGEAVAVELEASEDLAGTPQASLLTTPPTPMTCAPGAGARRWSCALAALAGTERPESLVEVAVSLLDAAGNGSVVTASVVLDFSAPALLAAGPGAARVPAGGTIGYTVTASEPLGPPPALTVRKAGVVQAGFFGAPASASATSATYTRAVTAGQDGSYTVEVVLQDAAGNTSAALPGAGFTVDTVAPFVTAPPVVGPAPGTWRAGVVPTVSFSVSEPLAATPTVRLLTVSSPALTCTSPTAQAYTCALPLGLDPAVDQPEGTTSLSIAFADLAGNPGTASATGVLDYTAPLLLAAGPTAARFAAGGTIGYSASASEPLGLSPTLTVKRAGVTQAGFFGAPAASSSTSASWSKAAGAGQDGSYTVEVTLQDVAGNLSAAAPGLGFVVDGLAPQLAAGPTVAPLPAAWRAGVIPTVAFTVTEDLAAPPVVRLLSAAQPAFSCTSPVARSYTCTLSRALDAALDTPEGTTSISISFADQAGNPGSASTAAVLDFTPPALVPGTAALTLLPPPGSPLGNVSALGPLGKARLGFTFAEPLQADPVVRTRSPQQLPFGLVARSGNTYLYELTLDTSAHPVGSYVIEVDATDVAGNRWAAPYPVVPVTLQVDATAPAAPTQAKLVYTRVPWGRAAGGGPSYTVSGSAGAVEGGATVIAWDGSAASALEVARGLAAPDGSFSLVLLSDPVDLWVAAVDGAGIAGPRTQVLDVTWVASLAGKVAGSTAANPHRLEARTWFTGTLDQGDAQEVAGAVVGALDGSMVITEGAGVYLPVALGGGPSARNGSAFAYDPVRGQAVLFGGYASPTTLGETWAWSGQGWTLASPLDPEGDGSPSPRNNTATCFSPMDGGVAMYGGSISPYTSSDLWIWNGASWRLVVPGPTWPGQRAGAAMVPDTQRGVLVLFGGSGLPTPSGTWEWNGLTWRQSLAATPAGRTGHAMVFDPRRGKTILFGGSASNVDQADTWSWDGTSWTNLGLSGPSARNGSHMAFDERSGEVVLYGGFSSPTTLQADTWVLRWTGAAYQWVALAPTDPEGDGNPAAAYGHRLAWDTRRRAVVLFNQDGVVWEWSGASWARRTPGDPEGDGNPNTSGAPTRQAVYDPGANGGKGAVWYYDGTQVGAPWMWNRTSWKRGPLTGNPTFPGTLPSQTSQGRSSAALAYDPGGARTVLFGGRGNLYGTLAADTWAWNGAAWSLAQATAPGALATGREAMSLAGDPGWGDVVLFAGSAGVTYYGDAWTWSGGTWSPITIDDPEGDGSPSATSGAASSLIYDSGRGRVVHWEYNTGMWELVRRSSTAASWRLSARADPELDGHPANGTLYFDKGRLAPAFIDTTMSPSPQPWLWSWTTRSWKKQRVSGFPGAGGPSTQWTAVAYDDVARHAVVVGAEPWVWDSGPTAVPGHVLKVDFSAAHGPDPALCLDPLATCPILEVSLSWVAGADVDGVLSAPLLHAWKGRWEQVGTGTGTTAAAASIGYSSLGGSSAALGSLFHGPSRELAFAVIPTGRPLTGAQLQRVATDYAEVTVRYRRPAGP